MSGGAGSMNLTSNLKAQVEDEFKEFNCDVRFIFKYENESQGVEIKGKGTITTAISIKNRTIGAYLESFESDCFNNEAFEKNCLSLNNKLLHELDIDDLMSSVGWTDRYLTILREDLEQYLHVQLENKVAGEYNPDPSRMIAIDVKSKVIA